MGTVLERGAGKNRKRNTIVRRSRRTTESAATTVRAPVPAFAGLLLPRSPVVGHRCFDEFQVGEPLRLGDLPEE